MTIYDTCINLDWLEVFCKEDPHQPIPAAFVSSQNVKVRSRAYGTPQYREMYCVLDETNLPILEVRRDPYLSATGAPILAPGSCHLRLANRVLYTRNYLEPLRRFVAAFNLTICGLSRVDFARDFNTFKYGYRPENFTRNYMECRLAKLHQPTLAAYGKAEWGANYFNSLKWGSPQSMVTTKLYDKTLELDRPGHDKPYIREQWRAAGLDESRHVWRVEHSVRSSGKGFANREDGEFIPLDINHLSNRVEVLKFYKMLSDRYMDFRIVRHNRNGKLQRKDRCKRIDLENLDGATAYQPVKLSNKERAGRVDMMIVKRLSELAEREDITPMQRRTITNMLAVYPDLVALRNLPQDVSFFGVETTAQ